MMKRSAKLLIMLGILAILVGGAVVQKVFFSAEPDVGLSEDGGSSVQYAVNDVVAENVTAFTYERDGESLSFKKNGEAWVLDEENAPKIDGDLVSAMVSAIASPGGKNKMENVPSENLASYGLDAPALSVTVYEGSRIRTYLFGSYNKTAKEYYFCNRAISDIVYTVPSSSFEAFAYSLEDLIVHEKLPEITEDSITSVSFENAEGMAEEISAWNIDEFVTLNDAEKSEYGFDSPSYLTVNYTERKEIEAEGTSGGYIDTEKSFTLVLGKADAEGKYFVKTSENSRLIYKISTSIFTEIFG